MGIWGLVVAGVIVAAVAGVWTLRRARRRPLPPAQVRAREQARAWVKAAASDARPDGDWATALLDPVDAIGQADTEDSARGPVTQALTQLADDPGRLPRRPQLLPQLMAALADEATSAQRLAALIGTDPALAAQVLRRSNSAMVRVRGEPVDSLERAVALVGTQGIRHVVTVALMQPVVQLDGGTLGRLPVVVWDHTQASAARAAALAPAQHVDPLTAQLLALLHGLGALVVVQALRDHPPLGTAATADLLVTWSPRMAAAIARQWALPPIFTEALASEAGTPPARVLAQALADATAAMAPAGAAA